MRYADLTHAIAGESAEVWRIHNRALQARARGEAVHILSVGDTDLDSPQAVVDSAVRALRAGDTHYAPVAGRPVLRDLIAQRHKTHCGAAVDRDNVIVLAGAQNGLFATSLCIAQAGDEVIVLQPMYVTYEACIQLTGANLVPVAMDAERHFRLDRAALRAAITPRTRAIYFASPCNPTGVILDGDELAFIAELARQHDLWVVSDEVYAEVVFDGVHQSMAGLPGMDERTVTIGSLSKSHAMTGWRAGWVIAPKPLIGHLQKLALCMLYGLPGFVQEAAITALQAGETHTRSMRATLCRRRDLVLEALDGVSGLRVLRPHGSMFVFINVEATGLGSAEFVEQLFVAKGVSLLDGAAFGACGRGFVRLSYATDEVELAVACQHIAAFVDGL